MARSIEASRAAAQALLGALDEAGAYQLEIELRVRDKTLDQGPVPGPLAASPGVLGSAPGAFDSAARGVRGPRPGFP